MHMNSAPHLRNEDRPEFERVLDETLHAFGAVPGPGTAEPSRLNAEQLRTMAFGAVESISACAAVEYQEYLEVRDGLRENEQDDQEERDEQDIRDDQEAAGASDGAHRTVPGSRSFGFAAMGVADTAGSGAGLLAVAAVLTPLLAGAAALIFLLLGYALHAVTPEPAIAAPLRLAGWLFAAVAAAGVAAGMIGVVVTALRNTSAAVGTDGPVLAPAVVQARETWCRALRERGVEPFLRKAIAEAAFAPRTGADPKSTYDVGHGPRMPRLGYSRPDFTSPGDAGTADSGPRFSSPDFSSPDFSGPGFSGPGFSGPGFSDPDLTGQDEGPA